MARNPTLDVFCNARRAGSLSRSEVHEGDYLFGYGEDCRAGDAVSLTMPVVRDQYDSMNTVHPVFEMNLPEGALLEKLRLRFAKTIPGFDDLALLEITGQSQIGRLRYARPGATPQEPPQENLQRLLTYRGADDLFADLLERYAGYSGVSGVQPKVLLRADQAELPRLTHRGTTHIVKSFDPREYPELAANEYFCTRAALHAGIPVPAMTLSDNRRLLVVERFDLHAGGAYLGHEDFCVLSGLRSHGRYEGSYELVAQRIREFVAPEHVTDALQQLFLTVALCCGIENGDAHLKNFAVLYEHAESPVRMAPAYDLVCTTLYLHRDVLALTLGGSKTFPDHRRLLDFGRRSCGLTASRLTGLLGQAVSGIGKARTDIRRFMKRNPDFKPAGERLIERFTRGVRRLRPE